MKDTDILIEGRIIIGKKDSPQMRFGKAVTGSFSHNYIYTLGAYTPRMFRRPRLARFAPQAQRVALLRAVWEWTA
jgi:hypothetical protein